MPVFAERDLFYKHGLEFQQQQIQEKPVFRAYDPKHDINNVLHVQKLLDTAPEQYQQELHITLDTVDVNWRTFLAEMYGVAVHESEYTITDNTLRDKKTGQSIVSVIQKGYEAGLSLLSQEDTARNKAELTAFTQLEKVLVAEKDSIEDGTMFVVATLQGSAQSMFRGNYVDTLTKTGDELRFERYATSLRPQEMAQKLNVLSGEQLYLTNATQLDLKGRFTTVGVCQIDEIKETLALGDSEISDEQFAYILHYIQQAKTLYLEALQEVPPNTEKVSKRFNGVVNLADHALVGLQNVVKDRVPYLYGSYDNDHVAQPSLDDIYYYSYQPVQARRLPCGMVGEESVEIGYGMPGVRVFGFTDPWFATAYDLGHLFQTYAKDEDQYGTLWIQCESEGCKTKYKRTPGKLEKKCKKCGGEKGITC